MGTSEKLTRRQFICATLEAGGLLFLSWLLRKIRVTPYVAVASNSGETEYRQYLPVVEKPGIPLEMGLTASEIWPELLIYYPSSVNDLSPEDNLKRRQELLKLLVKPHTSSSDYETYREEYCRLYARSKYNTEEEYFNYKQNLLDDIKESKIKIVRLGAFKWHKAEITPGIYDETYLGNIKQVIDDLQNIGVHVWVNVKGAPAFAREPGSPVCAQYNDQGLDAFAGLVAKIVEMNPNVAVWEFGNEPDVSENLAGSPDYIGCWARWDNEDGYYQGGWRYAQMIQIANRAVKRYHPSARVAAGALLFDNAGKPAKFIDGMIDYFVAHPEEVCFDILSLHAYAYGADPPYDVDRTDKWPGGIIQQRVGYIKAKLAAAGLSPTLVIGEGALKCPLWTQGETCGPDFEDQKAGYLIWAYVRALALEVKSYFWYSFFNPGWMQVGLVDQDGNKTPAFYTMQFLDQIFNPPASHPQQRAVVEGYCHDEDKDIEGYIIKGADGNRYQILWTHSDKTAVIDTPENAAQIYNFKGEPQPIKETLTIGWNPIVICLANDR